MAMKPAMKAPMAAKKTAAKPAPAKKTAPKGKLPPGLANYMANKGKSKGAM